MRALCETLGAAGYTTQGFNSPAAALAALQPGSFDLLLTDLMMPGMDGIALLAAARRIDPDIGAIVMTGQGTIDTAVQAMQGGALDYILKPFRLAVILPVIARALDLQRLRRENAMLQERERRRSEELAAAYQQLEAFSYSISHDLRAPLQFVKGFAGMLEDQYATELGEEGVRMLHVIRDGSSSMDEMIVGLLAFSRAGMHPLRMTPLDMTAIAHAALAEALSTYQGPAALVDIGSLPPAAGDSVVIRHAWTNLIGNALKYSAGRAEPKITISGRLEGAESIYSVQDNGAGFDMTYADKLFGVFKRLHSAKDYPGTGVGLAIVHRIVTRHGGRIWAQGAPGAGACFEFALPTAASVLQDIEAVQA
jgi:light-regulated signal transduction histidine kinase (bacteriophytochrome)/CheY-like chemotaxis protein